MQQFAVSAFNMVLYWHKLGEMDNERTSRNFIILFIVAISENHTLEPKITTLSYTQS